MARPSSPVLSRQVIADTALTIIDEEGAEALTLRRIAQRLGVRAPSLYNHVSSREDILDAVTESINSRLDLDAVADPDWRRGLIAFAHSYRRAYADHPNAVPLIAARDVRTEISVAGYDAMLHRLTEVGWAALTALEIMLMIDQLVLGSAITPFAALLHIPAEKAKGHPALAAVLAKADPETIDDAAFDLAVTTLLTALDPDRHGQR